MRSLRSCCYTLALMVALGLTSAALAQTGHVLNGVGPLDQSWSGAGMANPQDALTALHWNPAAITTFDHSTLDLSLQVLYPRTDLTSSITQGAFGPENPPVTLRGTSDSDAGPFPIPAAGLVLQPPLSRWTFGVSAFGVGGFGVDYAATAPTDPQGNPITFPQSAGGFGAINSSFALFQVAPTLAYQVTDQVSLGLAPSFNVGLLEVNPFPATSPSLTGYPDGPRTSALGIGFQVGLHAEDLNGFHAGVSFKSTQYFDDYDFESDGRSFSFNLDYPMILSAGIGYSGIERLELAADVRYIDFENTDGFDRSGFDATGAVQGFGWKSILVAAFGMQYEVTDRIPIRAGYAYNESPIEDAMAFYNVAAPAVVQHHISGGLSYRFSPQVTASVAVQYAPPNEVGCPMQNPQMLAQQPTTDMPGTHVKTTLSTWTGVAGVSVRIR